jgi:hypothetical protein
MLLAYQTEPEKNMPPTAAQIEISQIYTEYVVGILDADHLAGGGSDLPTNKLLNKLVREYTKAYGLTFESEGSKSAPAGAVRENDHFVPCALTARRLKTNDLIGDPERRRTFIMRQLEEGAPVVRLLETEHDALNASNHFKSMMPSIEVLASLNPYFADQLAVAGSDILRATILAERGPIDYMERYWAKKIPTNARRCTSI